MAAKVNKMVDKGENSSK